MASNSNRIEWIDIAKGMSIILVVYGHCGLAAVPLLANWFAGFMMPFFFFISGILFNPLKYDSIVSLAKMKWKGLIRPFFIFSIIVFLGFFLFDEDGFNERLSMFPTLGWGGYALWFIPVLFATECLYFFIAYNFQKKWTIYSLLIFCAAIGYLLDRFNVPNYWNLNFVLTSVLFFGLGNLLHDLLIKFFNRYSYTAICGVWTVGLVISALFFFNYPQPEFFVNSLGSGGLTHLIALGGTLMLCCTAALISKVGHALNRPVKYSFKYFGKNSYVVLAFHQLTIMMIMTIGKFENGVVGRILMWISLVLIIEFLTRYMPFVLGRSSNIKK